MTSTPQPPRFARWLLRRALDGPVRSAIIGDLDEEFSCILVERFGLRAARRWYWRQTLLSIAACLREPSVHSLEPAERISLRSAIMQDSRGLGTDFRAALRFCWRHPLLSAIVVSTLAVGVGVNAAAFSVLNATYFKKLPIAHADRFVSIGAKDGGSFTYPEYLALRDLPGIETLIAGGRTSTTLDSTIDDARTRQRIVIEMVTANYFSALGVGPGTRGRLFDAADGESGETSCRRVERHGMARAIWIGSFGDRTDRAPSPRDLHDRRRRACGFHRNTDWLQPRPLGAIDPGAPDRRQHRNAWPRCRVVGPGRRSRAHRITGDCHGGAQRQMESGRTR